MWPQNHLGFVDVIEDSFDLAQSMLSNEPIFYCTTGTERLRQLLPHNSPLFSTSCSFVSLARWKSPPTADQNTVVDPCVLPYLVSVGRAWYWALYCFPLLLAIPVSVPGWGHWYPLRGGTGWLRLKYETDSSKTWVLWSNKLSQPDKSSLPFTSC